MRMKMHKKSELWTNGIISLQHIGDQNFKVEIIGDYVGDVHLYDGQLVSKMIGQIKHKFWDFKIEPASSAKVKPTDTMMDEIKRMEMTLFARFPNDEIVKGLIDSEMDRMARVLAGG